MVDNPPKAIGIIKLLPKEVIKSDNEIPEELLAAVHYYEDDLPHSAMFSTEYRMWF